MKTLKRISLLILSVLLIFTFAGCDRGKVTEEETTDNEDLSINTNQEDDIFFDYIIPVEDVSSEDASEIIENLNLDKSEFKYETLDENKEIPLVYSIYNGKGYDIDGREFNEIAQLSGECSRCNKLKGIGENMCNGTCHINFENIPADSIPVPDYPGYITSK